MTSVANTGWDVLPWRFGFDGNPWVIARLVRWFASHKADWVVTNIEKDLYPVDTERFSPRPDRTTTAQLTPRHNWASHAIKGHRALLEALRLLSSDVRTRTHVDSPLKDR